MAKDLPISLTAAQCKGRTFIVSGANAGIGYEVAKHLVTLGTNRVIMAVRNLESGKAAKEDIENETGRKTVLQVWHLDLAEYASVEAFAKKASSELDRVDGLVANAGIANGSWAEYEGNEANITVNLISTLLLAVLMLPKLEQAAVDDKAAAPMITFVGTVNAFQVQSSLGKIDRSKDIISDLNDRQRWEMDIVNRCVFQTYIRRSRGLYA
jgi:NAD(P)-dependent dehydrogenase (short-subunit alcohol dehydrogenase family)